MKNYPSIGIQIARVFLPRPGVDLSKWSVIACDQFTSQPEYWKKVDDTVGDAPSTLNLIFPEVYLEQDGADERIQHIQKTMHEYLAQGILVPQDGLVYVERQVGGKTRKGLVLALDLEHYDYNKGSSSLIRATEGTIVDRLPPRIRIREGASLEVPHILVLIDDPAGSVIEPVGAARGKLKPLYDFELMAGSGHLSGYLVEDKNIEASVIQALERLADSKGFSAKYGLSTEKPVLLFAMGDGNHSLATAKAIWEKKKAQVGMDHPSRYALVEIENVHDQGLDFAPIHRVVFGLKQDILAAMKEHHQAGYAYAPCQDFAEMVRRVDDSTGVPQRIGVVSAQGCGVVEITNPSSNLPVGTLQSFLDGFMQGGGAEKIDYVHGEEVIQQLGQTPGNIAFYLPGMDKSDLFKTVILDGALPRKTFSMGEAHEKRFYMESREIV